MKKLQSESGMGVVGILAVIVVVVVLAGTLWFVTKKDKEQNTDTKTEQTSQSTSETPETPKQTEALTAETAKTLVETAYKAYLDAEAAGKDGLEAAKPHLTAGLQNTIGNDAMKFACVANATKYTAAENKVNSGTRTFSFDVTAQLVDGSSTSFTVDVSQANKAILYISC